MTPNQVRVYDSCHEQLKLAISLYDLNLKLSVSDVKISLNLRGRTGGQARYLGYMDYELRFNAQAIEEHIDFVISEIIPHEIAHIICRSKPSLGKNHDRGWVRVAERLGCSGSRTHPLPLSRAKSAVKHVYMVQGNEIKLGATQHKRLQTRKQTYSVKGVMGMRKIRIEPDMYSHSFKIHA